MVTDLIVGTAAWQYTAFGAAEPNFGAESLAS